MMNSVAYNYKPRSFERRSGRFSIAQRQASLDLFPRFGLKLEQGILNYQQLFANDAPCYLEIGFGTGQSLLAVAKTNPDKNFIGIEAHKPGIGAVLLGVESSNINNLRVFDADAVEVFEQCIPDESLAGIQIFFPDPWPKRRHHVRRLIKQDFVSLIVKKLKKFAEIHLATDWEDYAKQMMSVLSQEKNLINIAGFNQFTERSQFRPILTKFEKRAIREGREVRDLQFRK